MDKVSQFKSRTGAEHAVAKECLEAQGGDLEKAVKMYKFMATAQPPPGPQKNIEPKNLTADSGRVLPLYRPVCDERVNGTDKAHSKAQQNDNTLVKKLKRGLSKTTENIQLVSKARDFVMSDMAETIEDHSPTPHLLETPEYTFILPNLTRFSDDFRAFLHKDLIETSTLVTLEKAGRLNWWAEIGACQRLLPLATSGDGNCLLHAASLGMWGFHDRLLTLRKALCDCLTNGENKGSLWRRWRWQQTQANKQSGLLYSESEWQMEWEGLIKLASTKPRTAAGLNSANFCDSSGGIKGDHSAEADLEGDSELFYESLEEFHVFVLAHVLRRPVVVVADTMLKDSDGEALAPIPFGGIYLPMEVDPRDCHHSPLLLTYDAAHFSALVPMDQEDTHDISASLPVAIPLFDPELELLPIHFMVDPGPNYAWEKDKQGSEIFRHISLEDELGLIKKYMDVWLLDIPRIQHYETNGEFNRSTSNDALEDSPTSPDIGDGGMEIQEKVKNLEIGSSEKARNGEQSNGTEQNKNVQSSIKPPLPQENSKNKDGKVAKLGDKESKPPRQQEKDAKTAKLVEKDPKSAKTNDKDSKSAKQSDKESSKSAKQNDKDSKIAKQTDKESKLAKQTDKESKFAKQTDKENKLAKQNDKESKVAKQMQTVAKSFGSIGKSMSKKFKNLGGIGKTMKNAEQQDKKLRFIQLTENNYATHNNDITVDVLQRKDHILCAKLCYKRAHYQEEMIQNYLKVAEQRCLEEMELQKLRDEELRDRLDRRRKQEETLNSPVQCVVQGCEMMGTASTCYLCRSCYELHRKEAENMGYPPDGPKPSGEGLPVCGQVSLAVLPRQDTLTNLGTSKFYTYSDEDHSVTRSTLEKNRDLNQELNNARHPVASSQSSGRVELARSSFYVDDVSKTSTSPGSGSHREGTAAIVNNLVNDPGVKQDKKATYAVSCPQMVATQFTDISEPPLRCQVKNSAPTRQKAFKLGAKDVVDAGNGKQACMVDLPTKSTNLDLGGVQCQQWQVELPQQKCQSSSCEFYGTEATDFLCSACFKLKQRTLAYQAQRQSRL